MIRKLLVSSALLSGLLVSQQALAAKEASSPALAAPELKISGSVSFNSWFFKNTNKTLPGDASNDECKRQEFGRGNLFTVDDGRLKFAVEGKTDPGMEYGLVFVLDGDTDSDHTLRESYLFAGGSWGRVYAGDTYGVASTMSFGGSDPLGGTGGFGGETFDRVVNYTTGTIHSVHLKGDTSRDTKLTYLTPRWHGVQAGVSYTPRSEHHGEQKINARTSTKSPKEPFTTDNIASGVNFIHKFTNGLEVGLSGTSAFGKARSEYRGAQPRKSVASYAFGGSMKWSNWSFGAEYGNNGKSYQFKSIPGTNAGQFVDFGLAYNWGATKFSGGYFYGWRKTRNGNVNTPWIPTTKTKAKTQIINAAVDQKLAPGFGVYVEYAHYRLKNPAAAVEAARTNAVLDNCGQFQKGPVGNNTANAFVVGSRLVF